MNLKPHYKLRHKVTCVKSKKGLFYFFKDYTLKIITLHCIITTIVIITSNKLNIQKQILFIYNYFSCIFTQYF